MTWIGGLRSRLYARELHRLAHGLEAPAPEARAARQLAALNETWASVVTDSPYWARRVRELGLPPAFDSLEEYAAVVPLVGREEVQAHGAEMASARRKPDFVRLTGGSTSKPVQLPAWRNEVARTRFNQWIGRSWYGVDPGSRLFLLWGHSHLLGTGLPGWLRARRLELSDRLLGYHRFSAYDMRPEVLRRAAEVLAEFRPDYVVGYAVALDLFARANQERRDLLRAAGVRAVFGTAESFPASDSVERLSDLFGCPVGMEYGAVETAVVAHTHPEGGYRVFWPDNLVEAVGEGSRRRVVVTALYPRCFPLVRYEIGDELELEDPAAPGVGVERFARVAGRCNDYVELADGSLIHSEAFSHAVRACPPVRSFQVVIAGDGPSIRFTADRALEPAEAAALRERLGRIHPELQQLALARVDELSQTVAGKTRMVVSAQGAG